jgi:hypothetical protein
MAKSKNEEVSEEKRKMLGSIPESDWALLKITSVNRRITIREAVEEAVRDWNIKHSTEG